jgi:hypothetical protein
MIRDLERRLEKLAQGLAAAEKAQEQKHFNLYLRQKIKRFTDELTIKEWALIIVALYVAVSIGVLISKGLG